MMHPDPCSGPNHGNPDSLPAGHRRWTAGHLLSLTQESPGLSSPHLVFCTPDCLCDWHGQYAALQIDNADNEAFAIVGTFRLIWCSPLMSTVGVYDDWDELTEHIGSYQQQVLRLQDQAEETASRQSFVPPFDA